MKKIKMGITLNSGKILLKSLGADEKEIEKVKLDWFTKDMIDNFFIKQENHMLRV